MIFVEYSISGGNNAGAQPRDSLRLGVRFV